MTRFIDLLASGEKYISCDGNTYTLNKCQFKMWASQDRAWRISLRLEDLMFLPSTPAKNPKPEKRWRWAYWSEGINGAGEILTTDKYYTEEEFISRFDLEDYQWEKLTKTEREE